MKRIQGEIMEEEKKDEILDSSPETDEVEDPSTSEEQEEQVEEKDPPFNEHPRWQEVQSDRERLRQENEYWKNHAQSLVDKFQTSPAAPTQQEMDIVQKYGANDPGTREFLRDIKAEMKREANQIADTRSHQLLRENEALKRSVATIQEKLFRQDNVDVPQGSKEETEIAQLIQMGVPLEKATWAVMGPKRVDSAQRTGQTKQTNKVKSKVNANLERNTISSNSGLPQNEKLSFREKMARTVQEAGL